MPSSGKSISVDGLKIKELRKKEFTTQQRFAEKCDISEKTVQRAERGESIDPSVVNEMAKALKVDLGEIIVKGEEGEVIPEQEAPPHHEYLRLKQPSSAKELFAAAKSDIIEFEFDVDLDQTTAENIASFIEPLEALQVRNSADFVPPASEQLRTIGKLSDGLRELADAEICAFIGFTTYRRKNTEEFPTEYDYEIYVHSIANETKAVVQFSRCGTKTARVLTKVGLTYSEAREWLAENEKNKHSNVKVNWGDYPKIDITANKSSVGLEFDDEIPF